jgi:phosphate transport system protein
MAIETRDQKVQYLKDEILVLASMVEQMVRYSIDALIHRRPQDSEKVYIYDHEINQKHAQIEGQCLSLIATEPPILAADLRLLASLLEVNTEIERIGDAAKSIAELNLIICCEPPVAGIAQISTITNQILDSYFQAIGAFIAENIEGAKDVVSSRQVIDEELNSYQTSLLASMQDTALAINYISNYFRIVHHLHTILEHINNVCSRTVYMSTGDLPTSKEQLHLI